MGTTNNYNWPTPVATDLVKDGWEAIKDLGDAADTTVKAVSDAQGLIHINTTVITGNPAAVSVNDVFSATYTNYKILISGIKSTSTDVELRMRVGGTDANSANYHRQRLAVNGTSVAGLRTTGSTIAVLGESGLTEFLINTDIFRPFLAVPTLMYSANTYNGTSPIIMTHGNVHNVSTSYTGFTIFSAVSGTFTSGQIQVFGYKD